MRVADLYALRDVEALEGSLIFHNGAVGEEVLEALAEELRSKLGEAGADPKLIRRVCSIFIEQMQNLIRYSNEFLPGSTSDAAGGKRRGVIVSGIEDGVYFVASGNMVAKTDVDTLRQRLERVKISDKAALRAEYKERLRGPGEAKSKGASVGLIDMARHSSVPIEFGFLEVDEDYAFFGLKVFA